MLMILRYFGWIRELTTPVNAYLKKFYHISGLKINEDKTKALWIGKLCKSEKRMCKEYNLDWEQKPLKILGVTFTAEVFDIWDHNIEDTTHKINSLINLWSKRRLTLPGKITVIKSLILSKLTHLFLALPNPPGEFQKLLERKFLGSFNVAPPVTTFIWTYILHRITCCAIFAPLKYSNQ